MSTSGDHSGPRAVPMQGGGFYNQNARPQAAGGSFALPFLADAARRVTTGGPLVIADYGCSQGRNSLDPIRTAVDSLRARVGADLPISVVHTDQPDNDFASLFGLLRTSQDSYLAKDRNVFTSAVGRSFYHQLFPAGTVTLGWCSFAAQWLSAPPTVEVGHVWPLLSKPHARPLFTAQAAADWRLFLKQRARELRPGGRLVVVSPGVPEGESVVFETMMTWVQAELEAMVGDGMMRAAELARAVIPNYHRLPTEVRSPFVDGAFEGLVLEADDLKVVPDAMWESYLGDQDATALAERYAGFFQAAFQPSLMSALDVDRAAEFRAAFSARLEAGLHRRIMETPVRLVRTLAHTLVLARL